ncbi:uncharacterized protein NPIL_361161 [Nephila pilipes]|uniref:Uncharacterized protein n=1 Tax=Nephila pilipes TaxID=299642 RepID=A0A8X6NSR4_NEPPI|nr:uncharacterized protein NPIL_361161 [Nephila pilipes]
MMRLGSRLEALFLSTVFFSLCTSFVPRQKDLTTPKPTEETYTNENNKPSEIKHLKYPVPNPFSMFEPHIPLFRIPANPKVKDHMFGIEPHLMVSGRKKRSLLFPLGRYFFAQRMIGPQMPIIEYNQEDVEPCNVTVKENCTDEGIFEMPSTWQERKRKDQLAAAPRSPLNMKARRPYDVPQIGKSGLYYMYSKKLTTTKRRELVLV